MCSQVQDFLVHWRLYFLRFTNFVTDIRNSNRVWDTGAFSTTSAHAHSSCRRYKSSTYSPPIKKRKCECSRGSATGQDHRRSFLALLRSWAHTAILRTSGTCWGPPNRHPCRPARLTDMLVFSVSPSIDSMISV